MRTDTQINNSLTFIKVLFLSLLLLFTVTLFATNDNHSKDMDMIDLTASIIGQDVQLQWTSYSIIKEFEVQVATGSDQYGVLNWETIATVEVNSQNEYEFIDQNKKEKSIRYYRIKQVGFNKTEKFSDIKTTNFVHMNNFTMNVFPNSLFTSIDLQVNAVIDGNATFEVKSLIENYSFTEKIEIKPGFNEVDLSIDEKAPKGMYMLSFEMNGDIQTMVIEKQDLSDFMVTFE